MKVLLLTAHPLRESFHGALCETIASALQEAGHDVVACDLYADGFDPVLRAEGRRAYFDPSRNRAGVEHYIEQVFAAEALVLCFPIWCFGPPAILKGFMDRVFVPGVSFALGDDGRMHPNLRHIRRLVAVTTYGRPRLDAWWVGDPPRKLVTRYLRWFLARDARVRYLALYDLHRTEGRRHDGFLRRVRAEMQSL
jgi:NAD(P)H dehydrogenase (quinone)